MAIAAKSNGVLMEMQRTDWREEIQGGKKDEQNTYEKELQRGNLIRMNVEALQSENGETEEGDGVDQHQIVFDHQGKDTKGQSMLRRKIDWKTSLLTWSMRTGEK